MKILLIGANGFLGNNLLETFDGKNYELFTLSYRPSKEDYFCEELKSILLDFKPEFIINTAASQISGDDPHSLKELNSSNVLLNTFIAWGINQFSPMTLLVSFGSYWQYNNNIREPFNAYAASKSAVEAMLEHFVQDGLNVLWFELGDTYGPNDSRKKIVNSIIHSIKTEVPLNMTKGDQYINLVHICDVVDAVVSGMLMFKKKETGSFKKFSIMPSNPIKVKEIIKMLSIILDKDISYLFNLGYYEYSKRERFSTELNFPVLNGWKPKKELKKGLLELLKNNS
jgi:nucleoside-diphosphate-sugar epimerase